MLVLRRKYRLLLVEPDAGFCKRIVSAILRVAEIKRTLVIEHQVFIPRSGLGKLPPSCPDIVFLNARYLSDKDFFDTMPDPCNCLFVLCVNNSQVPEYQLYSRKLRARSRNVSRHMVSENYPDTLLYILVNDIISHLE